MITLGELQQTFLRTNPEMDAYARAIRSVESSGNYGAIGPATRKGNRAYGAYQVMDFNIGPWTEEVLGRRMTPEEFLADQQAQDAVFNAKFGSAVREHGNPDDAASIWFSGRPMQAAGNASDGYNTVPQYVSKFRNALGMPEATRGVTMQPEQQPGLLGNQQPQRRGLLGMDPDRQDRLAMALMAMSGSRAVQPMMEIVQGRMAERKEDAQLNRSVEFLRGVNPQLADAVQAKAMTAPEALRMHYTQAQASNDPSVQSSTMLPDNSGVVLTMRDSSVIVKTAGGETLSGQQAMDFVKNANAAYTEQQKTVYGARREGTLQADVALGADAEAAKAEGKMRPELANEFRQSAATVRSSITNMTDAIRAIDEGAQSGVVYDMLPNVTVASAELANARQRLGLDVIGSVTFGALSEAEMQLAMDTAMPTGLSPEQLRVWLERKTEAQRKTYTALQEAALHFASGGSMEDYLRQIGVEAPPGAPPAPAPSTDMNDDDLLNKYGG